MTAAVVQQLPVLESGIRIDLLGNGVARYCHRLPGDPATSETDEVERCKTIVALYAGVHAQWCFYRCNVSFGHARRFRQLGYDNAASDDFKTVRLLLDEMHAGMSLERVATAVRLRKEAGQLVKRHWTRIRSLAEALLRKETTPRTGVDENCRHFEGGVEKWISGFEIAELFRCHDIEVRALRGGLAE